MKTALSRFWFPLSLAGLLLLAIPGTVLLVLNWMGLGGTVNDWLEKNFNLSYHLAVPWWGGLVLLFLPLLIALLYFLKLKRKPLQVPSTFLWKKSIEDLHVNSLFQWLRDNVLLLLQILTILVLLYAVMAFQIHARTNAGRHYILMVDNSASMSATDVLPNRLEQAKQEALQEIDNYTDDDFGMVLIFSSTAGIRQSYTNDRNVLRRAINDVEPTHRTTRIGEALTLADSLANPQRSSDDNAVRPEGEEAGKERTYVAAEGIPTEVHLFSDGRFPDVADFALGNLNLQFHSIGQTGSESVDNIGLVTLNAVRDPRDASKLQVLATVNNYRPTKAEVTVRLEVTSDMDANDPRIYDQTLSLDARIPPAKDVESGEESASSVDSPGENSATFTIPDVNDRGNVVLHASLLNHKDQFADDDQAWLVIGVVRKARVLIVGPANNKPVRDFFDQEATQKVAVVTYLEPAGLKDDTAYRRPAREGAFDLVVFDRYTPEKEADLPLANTLFIDALPPPWKKDQMEKIKNVHVIGGNTKHPLMQFLTALQDIHVDEAFRFDLKAPGVPPRIPRLLETTKDTALLFTLARLSFTDVIMTFPIITNQDEWNTDWMKQISFPLFFRNVLYQLGNVSDSAGEPPVQPGQAKMIRPDVPVKKITVVNPRNDREALKRGNRADFLFGKTDHLGVYRIEAEGADERRFAVNLLDPDESNIEPRGQFRIGDMKIVPGKPHGQTRDLWQWVALAALLLVLVEWIVYNRRIFI